TFEYDGGQQIISEKTSETMREILESVVAEGTGNKTYIPGYRIGGKTATSEKLPRKRGKYIASFLAFAPADDPQVMALVLIDEPSGTYYGGSVAGPVMKTLMSNVLPYLGIEPWYTEEELELEEVKETEVPDFTGMNINEAKNLAVKNDFSAEISGEGDTVKDQFPKNGEKIRKHSKIILYT
ncbi:MAG: PASTA domain-containing protein, partial [Firmicutes bacterium]|nr:PASTA domain-containing protein [Bacillota bacterium]